MPTSNVKSVVVSLLDTLPDNCTWDDIAYATYVRRKIASGLNDAASENLIDHADVFREYHLDEDLVDETGTN